MQAIKQSERRETLYEKSKPCCELKLFLKVWSVRSARRRVHHLAAMRHLRPSGLLPAQDPGYKSVVGSLPHIAVQGIFRTNAMTRQYHCNVIA